MAVALSVGRACTLPVYCSPTPSCFQRNCKWFVFVFWTLNKAPMVVNDLWFVNSHCVAVVIWQTLRNDFQPSFKLYGLYFFIDMITGNIFTNIRLCTGSTRLEKAGTLNLMALSWGSRLLSARLIRESGMSVSICVSEQHIECLKLLNYTISYTLQILFLLSNSCALPSQV